MKMAPGSKGDVLSRLEIRKPDDWHVHLRDGAMLEAVVNFTARQFARAIIMPNLSPPITKASDAAAYRDRIIAAVDPALGFTPLMTCYLTDETSPADVEDGAKASVFSACKLYPANATTNSSHGVTNIRNIYGVLATMERIGLPLCVHGEVTDVEIDIFDREAIFIDRVLSEVIKDFPDLKVVFEHITTKNAVMFVDESGPHIAATITPHHLEFNRNAMFAGGILPHYYCLPVAKREIHRLSLRKAATSGSPKFFLGTDSAPHAIDAKESSCGCAGIFNAPCALESYAKTFEEEGALDRLEGFASEFGPAFYGLPINEQRVQLERVAMPLPSTIPTSEGDIHPFHGGEQMSWQLV